MSAPVERTVLFGRAFIQLSVANLAMSIAGAFQIHLSGFVKALGAGEAQVGLILALNALTAAVLGPFAGRWMDRQGRRIVVRTGALLWLVAAAGYLLIDRIGPQLYALRVLDGAAWTLLYATMFTYASELVPPERRTQGIALFGA